MYQNGAGHDRAQANVGLTIISPTHTTGSKSDQVEVILVKARISQFLSTRKLTREEEKALIHVYSNFSFRL